LNLTYFIAGIIMFLIGLAAALWGYNTANDCKSLGGIAGQIINQNIQQQCQYTPYAIFLLLLSMVAKLSAKTI
jgi:hypothetical protein